MGDEPRSLKSTYEAAEEHRRYLDGAYEASSPFYRDALASAIEEYQECLQLADRLALFSPNESLEDVSTSDLPYLLTSFYLGELIQKIASPTPHERVRALGAARDAYERFLHQLDAYGLLSPAHAKLFAAYTEDPHDFSTVPMTGDPSVRRDSKIANFRAEKELKARLEQLRQRPEFLDPEGGGDEEAVREVHLAHLDHSAHQAFQALEGLNRELEVLAQAPTPLMPMTSSVEDDERRRRATQAEEDGYSERLDPPLKRLQSTFNGPLLNKAGKPLQPFTLLGDRQELANGVFRPGHNLPTMTIDEYLAEERRRGGIIEGGGEASMRREEPDEDNMEKADAETMKARDWDEFTEANPRGSGNTLNRG